WHRRSLLKLYQPWKIQTSTIKKVNTTTIRKERRKPLSFWLHLLKMDLMNQVIFLVRKHRVLAFFQQARLHFYSAEVLHPLKWMKKDSKIMVSLRSQQRTVRKNKPNIQAQSSLVAFMLQKIRRTMRK